MKTYSHWAVVLAVGFAVQTAWAAAITGTNDRSPRANTNGAATSPVVRVTVDPRVELISVIFRLAGNPEYSQGRVTSYAAAVDQHFAAQREHAVVKLARRLRNSRGVSYDACMSLAVQLTNAYEPRLRVPLKPWPGGLDSRWNASSVNDFLATARSFTAAGAFREFCAQQQALYETTETRMRALLEKEAHLEWFRDYFGERPQATFTVVLGLLNGGCCYGARCLETSGREDLYCILGVWQTDAQGLPEFTRGMVDTVIHEFAHSYANVLTDRHAAALRKSSERLYRTVAARMKAQAYGDAPTMLREYLVRACVIRYLHRYDGAAAARRAAQSEVGKGFLAMPELADCLGEYEAQRDRYPTLDAFAPRLVECLQQNAEKHAQAQEALAARRPKIASLIPANGATNVDPALDKITVVFDRPMRDGSWALVGGGPNHPESAGPCAYDARRTTWTLPVKLKPDWDYQFGLNSWQYDGFRSEEGVPLEPVSVRFKTGKPKPAP